MVVKGTVSTAEEGRFRIVVDGRVSSPLPRMQTVILTPECQEAEISVGDEVLAVFLSGTSLASGYILGKVDE